MTPMRDLDGADLHPDLLETGIDINALAEAVAAVEAVEARQMQTEPMEQV